MKHQFSTKSKASKLVDVILAITIIIFASACASTSRENELLEEDVVSSESLSKDTTPVSEAKAKLDKTEYGGVVYIEKDGEPIMIYAEGILDNGTQITIDTPMPIGSVSKQFCAASILLLQERGNLSVKDTLDKYFPEYADAAKITLHDMLSMRSGIPEYSLNAATYDVPEETNIAALKADIFSHELTAEPNSDFNYSNTNYFLLALIVEDVSGMNYVDFVRENFWEPLGMTHTGSLEELASSPEWAQGCTYEGLDKQPGLTKGCGDMISNAADITIWLNSLKNGDVLSTENFEIMTTDYSGGKQYGYAFRPGISGGAAHAGENGIYTAFDYINTDKEFTLFMASNSESAAKTSNLFMDILNLLIK